MYESNNSYGKKAYDEVSSLKAYIGKELSNINKFCGKLNRQKMYFKINGSNSDIVKNVTIASKKSIGSVKIYIDNDINISNNTVEISNNGIIVYRGKLENLDLEFVFDILNDIKLTIKNFDNDNVSISIVFEGYFDTVRSGKIIESFDQKIVIAEDAIDETYVYIYDDEDRLINDNPAYKYSVPILLLDVKTVYDFDLFSGRDCVLLGKNSLGQLVYYRLSEEFAIEHVVCNQSCITAKISSGCNKFSIYCITENNVIRINHSTGEFVSEIVDIPNRVKYKKLYTASTTNTFTTGMDLLVLIADNNQLYLVALTQDVILCNYVGNADSATISNMEDDIVMFVSNEFSVNKYSIKLDSGNKWLTIKKVNEICPCDLIYKFGKLELKLYKNYITIGL